MQPGEQTYQRDYVVLEAQVQASGSGFAIDPDMLTEGLFALQPRSPGHDFLDVHPQHEDPALIAQREEVARELYMIRAELEMKLAELRSHDKDGAAETAVADLMQQIGSIDHAICEARYGSPATLAAVAATLPALTSSVTGNAAETVRAGSLQIGLNFAEMTDDAIMASADSYFERQQHYPSTPRIDAIREARQIASAGGDMRLTLALDVDLAEAHLERATADGATEEELAILRREVQAAKERQAEVEERRAREELAREASRQADAQGLSGEARDQFVEQHVEANVEARTAEGIAESGARATALAEETAGRSATQAERITDERNIINDEVGIDRNDLNYQQRIEAGAAIIRSAESNASSNMSRIGEGGISSAAARLSQSRASERNTVLASILESEQFAAPSSQVEEAEQVEPENNPLPGGNSPASTTQRTV